MKSTAEVIKYYRKKAGLQQNELGKMLSLSGKAISAWETGRAVPPLATIDKIAKTLNCSKAELTGTTLQESGPVFKLPFTDAEEARQYLERIPMLMDITEVNIYRLSDEQTIQYANDIIQMLKIVVR